MPTTSFIDLPIVVDPTLLSNESTDLLQNAFVARGITGWAPAAADLEIIQIQILANMYSEVAALSAQVPPSIFRAFGTKLFNVPYRYAVPATATTVWELTDTLGHTIPALTFVSIGGEGFYPTADTIVAPGFAAAAITVVAVDTGTVYNGLGDPTSLIDGLSFVASVSTTGVSADGVDAEPDADYLNRLTAELTLQAPRPITANDYAIFVGAFAPIAALGQDQQDVGRATAIDGFSPTSSNFTCTTSSGSPNVTAVTGPGTFTIPAVGATVTGTSVPANTTVLASPAPTTTTFTMSNNATGAAAAGLVLAVSSS